MRYTNSKWIAVMSRLVLVVLTMTLQARSAEAQYFLRELVLDTGADGASTSLDKVITSTTPTELLSLTASLSSAHGHVCTVVGSADVNYNTDFDVGNVYVFGLQVDGGPTSPPFVPTERELEFVGTGDFDVFNKSISTNMTFLVSPGPHTFRFSARKREASNPDITVEGSTLSVACLVKHI